MAPPGVSVWRVVSLPGSCLRRYRPAPTPTPTALDGAARTRSLPAAAHRADLRADWKGQQDGAPDRPEGPGALAGQTRAALPVAPHSDSGMTSTPVSSASEAAREAHRGHTGRFGVQPAWESECHLSAPEHLVRETARAAAQKALHDFDPAVPGTSGYGLSDLVGLHGTLTQAVSPTASEGEQARALAACVRGSQDGAGGLEPADWDTVMRGILSASTGQVAGLSATHHVAGVRAGSARPGAGLATAR